MQGYHFPIQSHRAVTRMSFRDLLDSWQHTPTVHKTVSEYSLRLPLQDAARLEALVELYPGVSREQLLTDLLHAALNEIAGSMPYRPGERIIREDEFGDPVFEDSGDTPRFIALTRRHLARLSEHT
jgi:hypothetical protein